jgi:hypothetical protein
VIDSACPTDNDKEITMITTRDDTSHKAIDLGDGLVLRRSNAADTQALSDFNALVHSDQGLVPGYEICVNDLMVASPTFCNDLHVGAGWYGKDPFP